MAASFRYSLTSAPAGRTDGSGCVDHQIIAQVDDGEGWVTLPGRNKTFVVPASELATVLALPANERVAAYKQTLIDNIDTSPIAVTGWTVVQLSAMYEANVAALSAASGADNYITVTLGLSYPVPFTV